jgi:hypothetical protein
VRAAARGSAECAVVCDSVRSRVQQCARGSATVYVRQCAGVQAAQCVCGNVRGSVWHCERLCAAARQCVAVRVAMCDMTLQHR